MPGPGTSRKFPHGKSVKNPDTYEALKREGMSKGKAAAISNAAFAKTGKRGVHRRGATATKPPRAKVSRKR